MKRVTSKVGMVLAIGFLLMTLPAVVHAQTELAKKAAAPIGQKLVREGDFALKLQPALGLGEAKDEVEAESRLGEAGIAPRNGWIADYPMTPDIVVEVQKSISAAVKAKKLSISNDGALKKFHEVAAEVDLHVKPYTAGKKAEAKTTTPETYPDQSAMNDYYSEEGPPVITYYEPPPDFVYLYAWVPCPFWWFDFFFPGFFVLRDFHRVVFFDNRIVFISNHFNDVRVHRVFRVDPVARFSGRTFAGIGVTSTKGFISTGVPRSARTIFNAPRTRMVPAGRMMAPGRMAPGGRMPAPGGRH